MSESKFNENGFAIERFDVVVHCFNPETLEFTESYMTTIPQGLGLPAHSTLIEPTPEKPGEARLFSVEKGQWLYIEDNRGKVYYTKAHGHEAVITAFGSVSTDLTEKPRPSQYHHWDENAGDWVHDDSAALADKVAEATMKRDQLMAKASGELTMLGYGQDLRGLTADEYKRMTALKRYAFDLYRLDLSDPDNVVWPQEV